MKRCAAPSVLWKKRRSDGGCLLDIPSSKHVNHLEIYSEKSEYAAEADEEDHVGVFDGPNSERECVKKNYIINDPKVEICFAVRYKNTKLGAKTNLFGDGVIVVSHSSVLLYNMSGKMISSLEIERIPKSTNLQDLTTGDDQQQKIVPIKSKKDSNMYIYPNNYVMIAKQFVEIRFEVAVEEFKSGSFFMNTPCEIEKKHKESTRSRNGYICMAVRRPSNFVVPFKGNSSYNRHFKRQEPLFDPNAPDAVVLHNSNPLKKEVAVVIDPVLSKCLRPHQVQGVKFLYDCVMGNRGFKGNGCILADDMGLGKTIQAITLIWTLMNQGPNCEPAVKKTVIVAPSSLVDNWCKEFKKWLGDETVDPIPFGDSNKKKVKSALARFEYSYDVKTNILVASYDQLKIHIEKIHKIKGIDLLVCDEGHRLKNANSKQSISINRIPAKKRIILSGTPIQNDLGEFHAMVSFCNPGILRDLNVFQTVYADKIMAMREPTATLEEKEIGRERSLTLSKLTSEFILRRLAIVNRKYLPPKIDHLIICKLSKLQEQIYTYICQSSQNASLGSERAAAFSSITDLKKVCNDPSIVYESYKEFFEPSYKADEFNPKLSSKIQFVNQFLKDLRSRTRDKVVIVSNYTQTLSVIAKMCKINNWGYFQLDGSTPVLKRQVMVDEFNNQFRDEFVFLLSSKAGGCGLNLVGANHLVMFDPDWNPANDLQAMARVWRPGQVKKVFLYRTLCAGTIEEKILQRQIAKLSLADTVVSGDADSTMDFSTKDLRDIFTYRGTETLSDTHDMLNCRCIKSGKKIPLHKRQGAKVDELINWEHYCDMDKIKQHELFKNSKDIISFVFLKETDPAKECENEDSHDQVEQVDINFCEFEDNSSEGGTHAACYDDGDDVMSL